MKIIHTADLHLDSKMESNLSKEKAQIRKNETLETFRKMVDYANSNNVKAILISGDLFDKSSPSKFSQSIVKNQIEQNNGITFYYLKGNHDEGGFIENWDSVPDNLRLFDKSWKSYDEGNVVITGIEMGSDEGSIYNTLSLDTTKINIVMLHGQENTYKAKDKTEVIALNELKNKCIDYLALGHVHFYKKEKLDARGTYCYPGCLEGRGFDECGEHGFMLLDIDEQKKTVESSFIPFASRRLYEIKADMNGVMTTSEAETAVEKVLSEENADRESLVKVVLSGEIDINAEINTNYLESHFADRFFFLKVKDETSIKVDYEAFATDQSLKGEFVRTVRNDETLSDEEKSQIIKMGIDALRGNK